MQARHVVLVGFMGAGKTTVGRLVADRLGLPFVDSDARIEAQQGRTVQEVFAADGEEAFRDVEAAAVAELLDGPPSVLSLGGGALGRLATRARVAGQQVVHLDVSLGEALARVGGDARRPVLARDDLPALHAQRRAVSAGVATAEVSVDGRDPAAIADEVVALLARRASEPVAEPSLDSRG